MSIVKERLESYKLIKEIRDRGESICIPFYEKFPKLSKFVPGIVKGIMYKVAASSGVGKTQLTKQLFVILPLDYMRAHPESKIKVKIFYFALEESQDEFVDSLMSATLAIKYGKRIDPTELKGLRENYIDDDTLAMLQSCEEDVQYYMDHIEIIDSISNPTGIYKYCRDYSERNGVHYWDEVEFIKKGSDGVTETSIEKVYSHYVANDPNEHVIVITDHISLLEPEYDKKSNTILNQHGSMAKWSTQYCKKQITKHWNWTTVNVQQQDQSNEKQHYTNSGDSVVAKTEPTLDALANNKEIQRDDYVVLSLYSPDRYGFKEYNGYDIGRMRDTFRAIKILKNRIGVPNKYVNLLFDGATNRFKELPLPNEMTELPRFYEAADKLLGRI